MELIMVICGIVLLVCIVSDKLSSKIGIPALLAFILVGMCFGSDGLFKIEFDNYKLAEQICAVSLVVIMFYGGFSTNWEVAKPVALKAMILSTLGVVMTAFLTATFCHLILKFDIKESFLLGAVISSTDAASVFAILRSKNLNLKGGLASLLEIESGSNDPFSYMLTVIALSMMESQGVDSVGLMIVMQIIIGVIVGGGLAKGAIWLLKNKRIIVSGFDTIFVVAIMILAYSIAALLGGNGYLSVYIAGIIMGNSKLEHTNLLVHFFDGVTGLAQIMIFFLLGLLAFPSQMPGIIGKSMLVVIFLTLIARPITIFILMARGHNWREKLFVSWAGLRGASSIVFAIMATISPAYTKNDIFHIVFCICLISISIQGTLLAYVAKKLDLIDAGNDVLKTFNDYQEESSINLMRVFVPSGHAWEHKKISEIDLPTEALALMIKRDKETHIPKGDTEIKTNDTIILSVPTFNIGSDIKLREIVIGKEHSWKNQCIENLNLPNEILIAMIKRGDRSIIPRGKTKIKENDILVIYD